MCVCENIKLGLRRCGHYVLGVENEMAQTSVVQITAMYCHGHFSPKAAKHLHSSRKNTKIPPTLLALTHLARKHYCPFGQ